MEDQQLRELFRRITDTYTLAPETAEELLRRILKILFRDNPASKNS